MISISNRPALRRCCGAIRQAEGQAAMGGSEDGRRDHGTAGPRGQGTPKSKETPNHKPENLRCLRYLGFGLGKRRQAGGTKERGLALAAGPVLPPGKLAHLELIGPEVDQQTVFETGGLQATKHNDWIRPVVE